MSNSALLVTGASGKLGRRVVELLIAQNAGPLIATTRNPESLADLAARGVEVRRADFDDAGSLARAFAGAERALLVSTDALDRPGRRLAQHTVAIKALETAGARHVVYTSLPNAPSSSVAIAPDHAQTEALLAASSLGYTVLRNNIYAEMLLGALPGALQGGTLAHARGTGGAAYVTREDCAAVAAAALARREEHGRLVFDVTGPEAVRADQLAALASELTGRPLAAVSLSPEALVDGMQAHGLPRPIAELLVTFDVSIARGELANVSDTVQRYTGRPARSLLEFLTEQRSALG
ncbi:MAG: SDR family oxidoreductase [Polyangiaceae bacterium]